MVCRLSIIDNTEDQIPIEKKLELYLDELISCLGPTAKRITSLQKDDDDLSSDSDY